MISSIHDRGHLENFLRSHIERHFYELGDLDDPFWNRAVWYAHENGGEISQLLLLYTGFALPVLMGYAETPQESFYELLAQALPYLPRRLYAHLSPGCRHIFESSFSIHPYGTYYQMALRDGNDTQRGGISALSKRCIPQMRRN